MSEFFGAQIENLAIMEYTSKIYKAEEDAKVCEEKTLGRKEFPRYLENILTIKSSKTIDFRYNWDNMEHHKWLC